MMKVDENTVGVLKNRYNAMMLQQAEYSSTVAEFSLATANALHAIGAKIDESVICLFCGLVRPRSQKQCPSHECKQ